MKKYIRALICITYSFVKFCVMKVLYFKEFNFTSINLISPLTEVEIGRESKLVLSKMVRMRSGAKVKTSKGSELRIGKNSFLNHGCIFIAHERIIIGDNVQFGPNVLIYDHDHDYKKHNGLKDYVTSPVEIGDNTWVGANVIILRGTRIGNNCVIAAGTILNGGSYADNTLIYQKRDTKINIIEQI